MRKILIFGFPHCGTSIVKSIIGHIKDVEEIYEEVSEINIESKSEFIVAKNPFTLDKYFTEEFSDYIKIFIVRNPLFVFSSLNKRFNYQIPKEHTIDDYIRVIKLFHQYTISKTKNLYTIRYEDLFPNNYSAFKFILNDIGLQYTDEIFQNQKYKNYIMNNIKDIPKDKPLNTNHEMYRTFQINQPFVCNNDVSKINLTLLQKEKIMNNEEIRNIYKL